MTAPRLILRILTLSTLIGMTLFAGGCLAEWLVDRKIQAAEERWAQEAETLDAERLDIEHLYERQGLERNQKLERLGNKMRSFELRQARESEALQNLKRQASLIDGIGLAALGATGAAPVAWLTTARSYRRRYQQDKKNSLEGIFSAIETARQEHPEADDWWSGKGGETVKRTLDQFSPEVQKEFERWEAEQAARKAADLKAAEKAASRVAATEMTKPVDFPADRPVDGEA